MNQNKTSNSLLVNRVFNELSLIELYQILQLRSAVFVVEQVCPYLDMDDLDHCAHHLYYENDGIIVAYLRVLAPKDYDGHNASIGRVVVHPEFRGLGWGRRIMDEGIDYCQSHYAGPIKISAQLYLRHFYSSLGFKPTSKVYLEDGIPHLEMVMRKF